jgi:hypothetical protein
MRGLAGVVLGVVVLGVGVVALSSMAKPAKASGLPKGWVPPSGATFVQLPPGALPFTIDRWTWRAPTDLGQTVLITNHDNPQNDWVAVFVPDAAGQQRGILAVGTSQVSGLLAQNAVAPSSST